MLKTTLLCSLLPLVGGFACAKEIRITPDSDLEELLAGGVGPGDSIVLAEGTWEDPELQFEGLTGTSENPIHVRAETPGKVVLTGKVEFGVSGEHVVVSGLSVLNPERATDVFEFRTDAGPARHCRITGCSFEQTRPSAVDKKTLWVNLYGEANRVDHCYFAGKQNSGTTLVVWVDETPGGHRIDHNHFGPRPVLGENGGETIRIGTSESSELVSRTVVEENYFERCNGEGEVVSNKSCENVFRFNLFDLCEGALTLRHGHRCVAWRDRGVRGRRG